MKSQMQYWCGFKSPVWQGIFLWELTPLWCLYSLRVQSHALICAHVKNPICWQPCHCLDTKIPHTLIWLSNTALTAAVPHPDNMTPISWKGWRNTKKKKEKKKKRKQTCKREKKQSLIVTKTCDLTLPMSMGGGWRGSFPCSIRRAQRAISCASRSSAACRQ